MFLILPVSYEFETSLTPKKAARKLNHDLIEHRPTINIMSQGRFMRKHKFETVFYGCRTSQYDFQVFHHMAKKRDGGSTGFYGTIEAAKNGSKISGRFRKPVYTYVFACIWTLLIIFLALMMFALGEETGAAAALIVWAAGTFIMFWDDKKKYLRAYLDSFPKAESRQNDEQ